MEVKIGHANLDEEGRIVGGKGGDQTGAEVTIAEWWPMGWTHLVRAKNPEDAEKIAVTMEAACKNDNIGYDQNERLTLYNLAKAVNFDLAKISMPCECDCSSLVGVCANAIGANVNPAIVTGNMVNALKNSGKFEVLTASKYLSESGYLKRGDILVKQYKHTVVVLSSGRHITANEEAIQPKPVETVMYAESYDPSLKGAYRVEGMGDMYMRRGAGSGYKFITVVPAGAIVHNYGYYTAVSGKKWLYVKYGQFVGFISEKGLRKA